MTEEEEIKENYTSLSITQEEKFPIDNSSLGYIKCPKCLKFDSNLELIIPNYDFMVFSYFIISTMNIRIDICSRI